MTATTVDLAVPGRYHIVGVGGPGMSSYALVLAEMGHTVSGSDQRASPVLDRLAASGVTVYVGHDGHHVRGVDAVAVSTAIPADNLEVVAARRLGIPLLRRAELLAAICAQARAIGVAGAHGKTTTTAMLAAIATEAGLDPSFVIGGELTALGRGAHWSGGELLLVEADESDKTFLDLPLAGTVVTNVEPDFLHVYGTFHDLVAAFDVYLGAMSGPRVLCVDDPVTADLARRHAGTTYGCTPGADVRAMDVVAAGRGMRFAVERRGERLGEIELPLRGEHNVLNATGALAMGLELGASFEAARQALVEFGGVHRRFELRGGWDDVTLVDDYAHLPAEIDAVLGAARAGGDGWRRIVAVFQPNRYRRMAVLSPSYADAFRHADVAVITEIYPSGDAPLPGVTGKLVVDAVLDAHPWARVAWLPRRDDVIAYLERELRAGDVCISMGCGDVADLPDQLLAAVGARAAR